MMNTTIIKYVLIIRFLNIQQLTMMDTESKNHVKIVTGHIWEDYIEKCEDIRLSIGMRDLYSHRKETIERLFGTAKENHGFRYTQMIGKARMEMKAGLTFACMNLKNQLECWKEQGR